MPVTQGKKISASDAEIAAALEEASIPTLMMSMIHMSGDTSLLDGPISPNTAMLNEAQGFMSEEDKATVRAQALEVIKAYRDNGCRLPPPPSPQTFKRMLNFIVGEESIGDDYVQMMMEEMRLDDKDERRVQINGADRNTMQKMHVTVVGGGMSGILCGIRLKQAGIDFSILERSTGPGGTWHENRYPGCRVDIASHFYSYSFEPHYEWSKYFAEQSELQDYFEKMVEKYGLSEHISYSSEVIEARYDERQREWAIDYRRDGTVHSVRSQVMISAVGQLNRPKIPDIAGRDSFKGIQMHTAEWDPELEFRDKSVAVVGTGASAFQLVPELAKTAKSVVVFQRSPPWMMPNTIYHDTLDKGKQWCLDYLPYYQKWYRFLIFWPGSDAAYPMLHVDPKWEDDGQSINEMNKLFRDYLVDYIKGQVKDPELCAKVVPDYPPLGKRLLQDNGVWLQALQKENVTLVDRGVEEMCPEGLVDAAGERHEVDVVAWATGFHADRIMWPMKIVGKDGVALSEQWGNSPEAYLGVSIPNFPNLFCLYGPNTNLAHAGSLIFNSECQIRYIMQAIKIMLEDDISSVECKPDVCENYNKKLQEVVSGMVWAYPKMNNWYKNSEGKVTTTWPWLLVDYWKWTRHFKPEEYQLG